MWEKIRNILNDISTGSKAEADKRNDGIVLKIVAKGKTVAYLTTEEDGRIFVLTYTENFNITGILPFNMKHSEKPEIGKEYRSEVLWYAFAARVPSPSRPDFHEALERAGLTGNEPVLEIIGKVSQRSISVLGPSILTRQPKRYSAEGIVQNVEVVPKPCRKTAGFVPPDRP